MNIPNTSIVVFALLSVCSVQRVSGFSQMNRDDERDERLSSQSAVRIYVAAESTKFDNVEPAPNITVSSAYQPVVAQMLARSATFRRQYARIAAAPHLSVVVRSHAVMGSRLPALTNIRRAAHNRLEAVVSIAASARIAELIAHEIEHIIEQLDGVDLPVKARLRSSGVRRVTDQSLDAFETNRAIAAGLRVAREVAETPPARWARAQ
jgi:hypothetical protein